MAAIGTDRVLGIDNKLHRGRVRIKIGPTFYPEGSGRAAVDDLTERWSDWIATATGSSGLDVTATRLGAGSRSSMAARATPGLGLLHKGGSQLHGMAAALRVRRRRLRTSTKIEKPIAK